MGRAGKGSGYLEPSSRGQVYKPKTSVHTREIHEGNYVMLEETRGPTTIHGSGTLKTLEGRTEHNPEDASPGNLTDTASALVLNIQNRSRGVRHWKKLA